MPQSSSRIGRRLSIALGIVSVWASSIGLNDVVGMAPPVVWAQDIRPDAAAPSTEEPPEGPATMGVIGRAHAMISSRITDTADRLDAFLGEKRILDEANHSQLKIAVVRVTDEHGTELTKAIKLKIVLPRLQNRIHLIISQDDNGGVIESEDGTGLVEDLAPRAPPGGLTSALRLMLSSARDLNIYIDAGARVRIHPTVFSRLRYRRSIEFEHWALRFTHGVKWEEQFAENPHQWEAVSRLDFERPIPPNYFFRTSLQGAWYEGRYGYFVTLGFSLVHQIAERQVLAYEWSTLALTGQIVQLQNNTQVILDPDTRFRIEEMAFRIRYRQTIGWPWLFFEASAERAFRRYLDLESDFDGVWRTMAKLEVQFRDMEIKAGG